MKRASLRRLFFLLVILGGVGQVFGQTAICPAPIAGTAAGTFVAGWFNNAPSGTFNQDGYWASPPDGPIAYWNTPATGADLNVLAGQGNPYTVGSGVTREDVTTRIRLSGVNTTSLTAAATANDYLQFSFTTKSAFDRPYFLDRVGQGIWNTPAEYPYQLAVRLSTSSSFTTFDTLLENQSVTNTSAGGAYRGLETYRASTAVALRPNTTYYLRVYYYNATSSSGLAGTDDFQIGVTSACSDYGDGPNTYLTTQASAGAVEGITSALRLGTATADADSGALTNAAATADDTTGTDDEDGVSSFPALNAAATSYSVSVNVTNTSGAGATLAGWIDFNGSGTFQSAEGTTASVPTGTTGNVTLTWNGLSGLSAGTTTARIRLSSGSLTTATPGGYVAGLGEVEDYQVPIVPAPQQADLTMTKTGPSEVIVGQLMSYALVIRNAGPSAADSATFSDTVPSSLGGLSAVCIDNVGGAAGCTVNVSGNTVSGNIATFPSGGRQIVRISGTVTATGTFSNTATVSVPSGVTDTNAENNAATATTSSIADPVTSVPDACATPNYTGLLNVEGLSNSGGSFSTSVSGDPVVGVTASAATITNNPGGRVTGNSAGALRYEDPGPSQTGAFVHNTYTFSRRTPLQFVAGPDLAGPIKGPDSNMDIRADIMTFTAIGASPGFSWVVNETKAGTTTVTNGGTSIAITGPAPQGRPGSYAQFDIQSSGTMTGVRVQYETDHPNTGINSAQFALVVPGCLPDASDAPASYGAAQHEAQAGLTLGTLIDGEAAAQPSANADGDDTNASDDEDGVTAVPEVVAGQSTTIPVSVRNTTGADAYLAGFLDFNKDGDFLDAGEKSATVTVANNATTANLSFTTPPGTTAGTSYLRLRLSRSAAEVDTALGVASSGEVEDYRVPIASGENLAISKTGQTTVERGNSVLYTLKVWNRGVTSTTGATVTDTFASDFQNLEWACVGAGGAQCAAGSANATGAVSSNTAFSLTTGNLPVNPSSTPPTSGAFLTITLRSAINKNSTATSVTNTATVTPPLGGNPSSASATTTVTTNATVGACQTAGGSLGMTNLITLADGGTFGERSAGDNAWGSPVTDPYGGTYINTALYTYQQAPGVTASDRYSLVSASGTPGGVKAFHPSSHAQILDYDNPGFGRYVYVNGSTTRGVFFRQVLTGLSPDTTYQLSFVMLNVNVVNFNNPIIAVEIDGVEYYSSGTVNATTNPTWQPVTAIFNTGNKTSVLLELRNGQPQASGNDLALDSIRMATCSGLAGSVSGTVYSDDDRGDDLDASEPKVAGVEVRLLQGTTIVGTTTTDASGAYSFDGIALGNYTVRVQGLPAGYTFGTPNPLTVSLTTLTPNVPNVNFGLDNDAPTTADRTATSMPSSSGDTLLSAALSGADTNGGSVTGFRVTALPDPATGVLRWDDDGDPATPLLPVTVGTVVPTARAGSLFFDPVLGFSGNAVFQYAAIDNSNLQDPTPATYTIPITMFSDLTMTKTASSPFIRGGTGVYTLSVSNVGDAASSGTVTVTDTLPTGLSYTSASGAGWSCSAAGQVVTCTRDIAIAAATAAPDITLTVGVAETAPAEISNTAEVSGGGEVDTTNNTSTITTPTLDAGELTLAKTVRNVTSGGAAGLSNEGEPGDVLEYCIAYQNSGQSPVTEVLIGDDIPEETTALTSVPDYAGQALRWTITAPTPSAQNLSAASDGDAGTLAAALTLDVGTVPAGGAGDVCFRVTID